jgi:uncharacterized protein YbjQ (UPF0145 family)
MRTAVVELHNEIHELDQLYNEARRLALAELNAAAKNHDAEAVSKWALAYKAILDAHKL